MHSVKNHKKKSEQFREQSRKKSFDQAPIAAQVDFMRQQVIGIVEQNPEKAAIVLSLWLSEAEPKVQATQKIHKR